MVKNGEGGRWDLNPRPLGGNTSKQSDNTTRPLEVKLG